MAHSKRRSDIAIVVVFAAAVLLSLFAIAIAPRSGGSVAVISPPWWSQRDTMDLITRANGFLVRQGAWSWVVIAASTDRDFIGQLYAAGAWIVADPVAAGGCFFPSGDPI